MVYIFVNEKEKRSDETVHLLCSPCTRKERNKKADTYCMDCCDYYCSDCVKFHEDIPALSGHKILDKGQVNDGTSGTLPVLPTQRCDRHGFKPVDMYCQGHDNVGCTSCMAVDHTSCQDVFYVPEYVLLYDPTAECEDSQLKMLTVSDDIGFQLQIRQLEIKRLFKRKEEEVEKIKQFRIDMNSKLENLEKKSIDAIEDQYKALIKEFEEQITMLTKFQTDIFSSGEDIKSASSNVSQIFVGLKIAKSVIERVENRIIGKKEEFTRLDVVFECQQKLMSMINEMYMLGDTIKQPVTFKLKGRRYINTKHDSDTSTCGINSTCVLKDGSVIIADKYNKSLKRLDVTSSKIVDVCQLPRSPWQICEVDKEIAVSFGEMNINIVTTEGTLKVAREIKTDHDCYGLGYRKGRIYVTDSEDAVFVYNETGAKLNVQFAKDQSGHNLFNNILSLTISQDGDRIYVADGTQGLVILSKEGKLLGKNNSSTLPLLREICETDSGDIIICGENTNNIVQFAPNGDVVGEILPPDGDEGGCLTVCIDRKHKRLIVGRQARDYIELYDMN